MQDLIFLMAKIYYRSQINIMLSISKYKMLTGYSYVSILFSLKYQYEVVDFPLYSVECIG